MDTDQTEPSSYENHSTRDLMDGIEAALSDIVGETEGEVMGIAYAARDELWELHKRVTALEAENARLREALATTRRDALSHAVRRATGCLDYLGGLTGPGSEPLLREYHAGMRCVIGVLEGLRDGEDTTQTRALDVIGGAK